MNELEKSVQQKDGKIKELEERLTLSLQENRPVIHRRNRTLSRGHTSSSSFDVDTQPSNSTSHVHFYKDQNKVLSRPQSVVISQSGVEPKNVKFNEKGIKLLNKTNVRKQPGEQKINERSSQACVVM